MTSTHTTKPVNKSAKTVTVLIWITVGLILCSLVSLVFRLTDLSGPDVIPTQKQAFWDRQKPLQLSFTADGVDFSGELSRDENGVYTFLLDQPQTINGLQISYDTATAQAKASYGGITATLPKRLLPQNSIGLFASVLEKALSDTDVSQSDHGLLTQIDGEISGHAYTLTTDAGSGIIRLSVPDLQLDCHFSAKPE